MSAKSYQVDMTEGSLFKKILFFAVPLILSSTLQLLYNAADIVVVGRYAGSTALAAVGSTGSLINLLVNLFIGLSVGASVVTAQHFGAREPLEVSKTVHTSMLMSIIGGVFIAIVGFFLAKPLLALMDSPADVIDQAALYLKIYFLGMPAAMIYNFGSAILRAVGDTKRPLYYLTIAGIVNVALNLVFVIVFKMGVAGVAIATVISQIISAAFVVLCLMRTHDSTQLYLKQLAIDWQKAKMIIKIGLPAGIQSTFFSISNVLIQSSINSFGSVAMAGNAAAGNIEGFIYVGMNSLSQAALTVASQNVGAKRYDRLGKTFLNCVLIAVVIGMALGAAAYFFGPELLSLYAPGDEEVISFGMLRLEIIATTYFTCGIMDVLGSMLRGMGKSFMPMLVTLLGACGLRIVWIMTVFAQNRTLTTLYISYPVSWVVTALVHFVCYIIVKNKLLKRADMKDMVE